MRGAHSLEFFDGQFLFRSTNGTGENFKFLSPAAVAAAFRQAPIDSGWIPAGVVRCGHSPNGPFAVLFIPAQLTTIAIEGRAKPLSVRLPSFVFLGIGTRYFVWSTKAKEFDGRAELYIAPLPNVFSSGRICWGENKPPKATPAGIVEAWNLFISSPFSDHAANHKSISQPNDVRRLLIQLSRTRKPFPAGELLYEGPMLNPTINSLIGGRNDLDD